MVQRRTHGWLVGLRMPMRHRTRVALAPRAMWSLLALLSVEVCVGLTAALMIGGWGAVPPAQPDAEVSLARAAVITSPQLPVTVVATPAYTPAAALSTAPGAGSTAVPSAVTAYSAPLP